MQIPKFNLIRSVISPIFAKVIFKIRAIAKPIPVYRGWVIKTNHEPTCIYLQAGTENSTFAIFKPKIKTTSTGIHFCSEVLQIMVGYKNTCIV